MKLVPILIVMLHSQLKLIANIAESVSELTDTRRKVIPIDSGSSGKGCRGPPCSPQQVDNAAL
jgi:hypothetical protein